MRFDRFSTCRPGFRALVCCVALACGLLLLTASPASACSCDRGWDYYGNPIPVGLTGCSTQVCGLDNNTYGCNSSGWFLSSTASCGGSWAPLDTKFGVNSAIRVANDCSKEQATAAEGMGYYLEISFDSSDLSDAIASVNCAISNGIIPIVRICTGGSCGFRNVNDYVNFLINLDNSTSGLFYAIAGPNEPLSEQWVLPSPIPWTGGYSSSEINTIAAANVNYMNAVISGVGSRRATLGGEIGLLSVAFNCTNFQMDSFVGAMHANGANWNALSGIAGNGYNTNTSAGQTVTYWLNQCRNAFSRRGISAPYNQFFLTEIGAFESTLSSASPYQIPHSQALANLEAEVDRLRTNRNVRAALFFNGLGTSSDSRYAYGDLRGQWGYILSGGTSLGGGGTSPCPCSSDPSFDNFCFYPSNTANCPMTAPGGYCDPNGDGSYSDGDWTQGWYDYQAQCP